MNSLFDLLIGLFTCVIAVGTIGLSFVLFYTLITSILGY
jgi:hypothetical protein